MDRIDAMKVFVAPPDEGSQTGRTAGPPCIHPPRQDADADTAEAATSATVDPHPDPADRHQSGALSREGDARQFVELDARLSSALDRPTSSYRAAEPRMALRERLRRPLLILFPILLAAVGAVYYLVEAPYVSTDDAFVRAAKESDQCPGCRPGRGHCRRGQSARQAGSAPVPG